MKTTKELELLYNLEVAINALQRYLGDATSPASNIERWHNLYLAYDLCKAMTYTKLGISRLLDK